MKKKQQKDSVWVTGKECVIEWMFGHVCKASWFFFAMHQANQADLFFFWTSRFFFYGEGGENTTFQNGVGRKKRNL